MKKIVFLFLITLKVFSQESQEGEMIVCTADEHDYSHLPVVIRNSAKLKTGAVSASFEVDFTDFPSNAKTAFLGAVQVWESVLISKVPIRINASWESLASGTLASSGATKVYKNIKGNALRETWYPVALAEAISGENLNAKEYEINVKVNKNVSWSYDTDGTRQAFKYDLMTVILHEIAHGLGFTTSMKLNDNNGTQGQWGTSGVPYIYDTNIRSGASIVLTDASKIGNPSTELKTFFENGNLYFNIDNPIYKNKFPKIYAPSTFRSGGSISHLDEATYPKGTDNALMSPQIGAAEINHFPGQVILAVLNQIGWPVLFYNGLIITALEPEDISKKFVTFPNPFSEKINIIVPSYFEGKKADLKLISSNGSISALEKDVVFSSSFYTIEKLENLNPGVYFLKIISEDFQQTLKVVKP